jgi:hypothetical protein
MCEMTRLFVSRKRKYEEILFTSRKGGNMKRLINASLISIAMCCFLTCISANAEMREDFETMLLNRIVKGIMPPGFQINGQPVNYDQVQLNTVLMSFKSNPKYETYMLSKFVDTVPPAGATFKSTPNRFTSQYRRFIDALEVPVPDLVLAPKLKAARKKFDDLCARYDAVTLDVSKRWGRYRRSQIENHVPEEERTDYRQWLANSPNGERLITARDAAEDAGQDYLSLANQSSAQYRGLAASIVSFKNPGNMRNVLVPPAEDRQEIRYFEAIPGSINDFLVQSQSVEGVGQGWHYLKNSGWHTTETVGGSGGASLFGIINISGSGSSVKVDSGQDLEAFDVEFKAWQAIPIKPGEWFDPAVITDFKNGPFVPRSGFTPQNAEEKLWNAQTGSLPRMISTLIVVYKPSVRIQVSKNRYQELHTRLGGSVGLSIGPFSFGASGGGSKDDIRWDNENNTLIANGPDAVQVLAVINTSLPEYK